MYSYLYDIFTQESQYDRTLADIESHVAHVHLQGAVTRLSVLKAMYLEGWLKDELRRGVKTFIAVGNDHTFHRMMCLTQGQPITLGFIPVGNNNSMAKALGILKGREACETISRRFIKELPLSRVNDKYFLTSCRMPLPKGSTIHCDAVWQFTSTQAGTLAFSHLGPFVQGRIKGSIETKAWFKKAERSQFFVRSATLKNTRDITVQYDGEELKASVITVEATPCVARVIVGSSYEEQATAGQLQRGL